MASDRGAMTGETNLERGPRGEENPAAARCSGFGPGFRRGSGRVGSGEDELVCELVSGGSGL